MRSSSPRVMSQFLVRLTIDSKVLSPFGRSSCQSGIWDRLGGLSPNLKSENLSMSDFVSGRSGCYQAPYQEEAVRQATRKFRLERHAILIATLVFSGRTLPPGRSEERRVGKECVS